MKWLLFGVIAGSFTFGLAPLIDYLWPLWDEENRALHDMVVEQPGDPRLGGDRGASRGEAGCGRPRSR